MKLTVETAETICEKYGLELEHGTYLEARNKCGCAVGILSVAATNDLQKAEDVLSDDFSWADIAELTDTSVPYLIGLEAGFEGFGVEEYEVENPLESEDYRDGYREGAEIAIAGLEGHLPLHEEPEWEQELQRNARREVLKRIEEIEELALIKPNTLEGVTV